MKPNKKVREEEEEYLLAFARILDNLRTSLRKVTLTPFWFSALVAVAGCGSKGPVREPAFDPQFARALNATATEAAVAKPGAKVCHQMQVGIAERDWIRGVVSATSDGKITVTVEDAGRFPHELNGTAVVRGTTVSDVASAWIPCL